jgi:hypothetical protein
MLSCYFLATAKKEKPKGYRYQKAIATKLNFTSKACAASSASQKSLPTRKKFFKTKVSFVQKICTNFVQSLKTFYLKQ